MKEKICIAAALLTGLLLLSISAAGQASSPSHVGMVQDWTQSHLIFTREGLARHPEVMEREPRIRAQAQQRWPKPGPTNAMAPTAAQSASLKISSAKDWNVNSLTGRLVRFMYPQKYTFDPAKPPDCNNDYVLFGLSVVGSAAQANLVALNNLYTSTAGDGSGLCFDVNGVSDPTTLFAYNISTIATGKIPTSPVLSVDGTKVAFVESPTVAGGPSIFHVVTWTAGQGTIGAPAVPSAMASVTFSAGASCTRSSPWVDYLSDVAYVGDDTGKLYKISGVFRGTPTLVSDGTWPITLTTVRLGPPVLDSFIGKLMVGAANGTLYQIDINTGAVHSVAVGLAGSLSPGLNAAPVMDVTNGMTFAITSDGDGLNAYIKQIDSSTLAVKAQAIIGKGSASGTAVLLWEPAFSNDYYNNPDSGVVRLCGTGALDTTPWQYKFGFTGGIMHTLPDFSAQLSPTATSRCSGWTEFFNPNVGDGGTDFFFFGLTQDCSALGTTGGCVAALTGDTSVSSSAVQGGTSGIVVDNYSTAGEASNIYFSGAGINRLYKFTQSGLIQ